MSTAQGSFALEVELGSRVLDLDALGLFAADLCFSRHALASFSLSFSRAHNSRAHAQGLDWSQFLRLGIVAVRSDGRHSYPSRDPEYSSLSNRYEFASPNHSAPWLLEGVAWVLQHELDTQGGGAFVVQGFDRAAPMRGKARSRSWTGASLEQIGRQLAKEHGLRFEWSGEAEHSLSASDEAVSGARAKPQGDARIAGSPPGAGAAVFPSAPGGGAKLRTSAGQSAVSGRERGFGTGAEGPYGARSNFQAHESDWSFLCRLASQSSVEVQMHSDVLWMGKSPKDPALELNAASAEDGLSPTSIQAGGQSLDLLFRRPLFLPPASLLRMGGWGLRCDGEYRVEGLRLVLDGSGWTTFVQGSRF